MDMKYKVGQQVRLKDMNDMATILEVISGDTTLTRRYIIQYEDGFIGEYLEIDLTKHAVKNK
jgi:hypothetical protein